MPRGRRTTLADTKAKMEGKSVSPKVKKEAKSEGESVEQEMDESSPDMGEDDAPKKRRGIRKLMISVEE